MTLSIFADQLYMLEEFAGDKEAALDYGRSVGITAVEVFTGEFDDSTLHDYRAFIEAHGLTISTVIRVSNIPAKSEAEYQAEIAYIKNLIDATAKEGIEKMMIVPTANYIKTPEDKLFMRDRILRGMKEIMEYAKDTGVTIMMENFGNAFYPVGTAEEMQYIFDHVAGLKYNYDTGNFHFAGADAVEAYEALKEHVVAVHVKDWKYEENGYYNINGKSLSGCAIGDGFLPMKDIIARLKRDGYDGHLMIEINGGINSTKTIDASVAFLKGQLA